MIYSGLYLSRDLSAVDYRKADAVSQSTLKHLEDSPAHLQQSKTVVEKPKPHQIFGTLGHALILEPDKPLPQLAIVPETYPGDDGKPRKWSGNAEYCKRWLREAEAAGNIVIDADDLTDLRGMLESALRHREFTRYLATAQTEVSLFTTFEESAWVPGSKRALSVKARLDILPGDDFAILDVKTCVRGGAGKDFWRSVIDWGYDIQSAWYIDCYNQLANDRRNRFIIFAIEKKPPYACMLHELPKEIIELGRQKYRRLVSAYLDCEDSGIWPGYPDGVVPLVFPEWVFMDVARSPYTA